MPIRALNPSLGLLILRLVLGAVMIVHGAQKFGLFGGGGLEGTAGFFESLGVPSPGLSAIVVGLIELVGGIGIALGLLTPVFAALFAATMAVAILTVHLPNGFTGEGGYEFPLMLMASAVALIFTGPGRYSLDGRRTTTLPSAQNRSG